MECIRQIGDCTGRFAACEKIYYKRGYRDTEFKIILAKHNDFLCYDVCVKKCKFRYQMVEWTMENHEYKGIRNEIELVIKEFGLDRSRVSEVSKIAYASILRNVEKKFVLHGRQLHWSNMGGGFQPQLLGVTRDISDDTLWFKNLKNIVPDPQEKVYALFEDTKNYQPKYWVYEMFLEELIIILSEVWGLDDFYIVSKKYEWLITECHEDMVSFVGNGLKVCL